VIPGLALAALVAGHSGAAAPREPHRAEYAVRWNPAEGGLATVAEVLALLGASGERGETFEVRYFDVARPAGAPAGATTILRQRTGADGRAEIRLKYRRTRPLASAWGCPAGAPYRAVEEVDIGFGGADAPSRVYSYACTLAAAEPPAELHAVAKKCASRVTRFEVGSTRAEAYKVEEWKLPDGGIRLEVSRTAPNDVDELARFAGLVSKLRERGVRPLDESKTEMGSLCPNP
jgi:hypothetical protein